MVSGPFAAGLSFPAGGYVAIALTTEAELREEWSAMRNCTLEHIPACRRGACRALSLRDRESGARVATVILRKEDGGFVLHDARRRFNRPAGPDAWLAAQRAAAVFTAMTLGRRGRRASTCTRGQNHEPGGAGGVLSAEQVAFDFEAA